MQPKFALISLLAVSLGIATFSSLPREVSAATINVDTEEDLIDADGDCSLREAVIAANTNAAVDGCEAGEGAVTDVINLPAGEYVLTLNAPLFPNPGSESGAGNDPLVDDLDVTEALEIQGAGARSTIIDGNSTSRIFHIATNVSPFTLTGLTLQNGRQGESAGVGTDEHGGAIFSVGTGTIGLTEVAVRDNFAQCDGGAVQAAGTVVVVRSTINDNESGDCPDGLGTSTDSVGGGISAGAVSMHNSTISGNSAFSDGGGIHSGSATIENSTIAFNSSPAGGGISVSPGTTNLYHTILSNNTGGNCAASTGTTTSQGFNLSSDTTCNLTQLSDLFNNAFANLLPLDNYGGPTDTHALESSSSAVDSGDATCGPSVDQRGFTRPVDVPFVAGDGCDIGAFELQNLNSLHVDKECTPPDDPGLFDVVVLNANQQQVLGVSGLECGSDFGIAGFAPGTYMVVETPDAAFTTTYDGHCDSTGAVTVGPEDQVTCTIMNARIGFSTPTATVTPSSTNTPGPPGTPTRTRTPTRTPTRTATPLPTATSVPRTNVGGAIAAVVAAAGQSQAGAGALAPSVPPGTIQPPRTGDGGLR